MNDDRFAGLDDFGRKFFDSSTTFSRIGTGGIGGKAAGLLTISSEILADIEPVDGIEVAVPTVTVIGTDVFDAFMSRNGLYDSALSDRPDDRIALDFQQAAFPSEVVGDLRALVRDVHTPLAVRSSSLLEDALAHPFAGVYATKMIPNNQADVDTRFRRLMEAVKFVYASTFFRGARNYLRSIRQAPDAEKMAIVIQEVVGQRFGDRFYPSLSGVARSYNYYPSGRSRPEDGVVNLALGLGKQIVDGGVCWVYSPARPTAPAPFKDPRDQLENTQTQFWAVNMGRPPLPDPIHETEYLVEAKLEDAETDGSLRFVASTLDPESNSLRPGINVEGARVLDFAPLLQYGVLPLNQAVKALLERSKQVLGNEVEIEFAMNLDRVRGRPGRFGLLQLRPMAVGTDEVELSTADLSRPDVIVASSNVLGNGRRDDLVDIVFVKPQEFETRHTSRIAMELDQLNRDLQDQARPYVLIGFGRWGSADPWLGIPVQWGQISSARVIVEATLADLTPDLSQGSHFFHNLLGLRVFYLSVPRGDESGIDWTWLDRQERVAETRFVKHVRTRHPLNVVVDGREGRGVIRRHE
jgi:hypothetical protein